MQPGSKRNPKEINPHLENLSRTRQRATRYQQRMQASTNSATGGRAAKDIISEVMNASPCSLLRMQVLFPSAMAGRATRDSCSAELSAFLVPQAAPPLAHARIPTL